MPKDDGKSLYDYGHDDHEGSVGKGLVWAIPISFVLWVLILGLFFAVAHYVARHGLAGLNL